MRILVTGSEGLIGRSLVAELHARGHAVVGMDIKAGDYQDIRRLDDIRACLEGCDGVAHLAAIAGVVACELDPMTGIETNVTGTLNVINEILDCSHRPWLLFVSSRELYGETTEHEQPIHENAPWRPVNVYARSKAVGEDATNAARAHGVRTSIVRLANVYGDVRDIETRVMPAFARAASKGLPIIVRGFGKVFDLTHVSDVARGLAVACERVNAGGLPTVHLVSGAATTLGYLAKLAQAEGASRGHNIEIQVEPSAPYEVGAFVGDPWLALDVLDWRTAISVELGFRRLVEAFDSNG